jgi:PIN domain nuclease of toxin-antitoxin system
MNFVTDTHALLWWFIDSPKMSPTAGEIFERCEKGESLIFIPSIVIAEALSIFDKKRIAFDFRRLFQLINESENFVLVALDYPILQKMLGLRELPELHDKIIVSTAKYLNLPLITKDKTIQNLSFLKTIW